ncbi:hypothetical protein PIB30_059941 [Stylosanthes scabra]|uniref:Uncharacterized protein n=1 Tax=Stylosanthes scabra TaxID=79078 RepID=A0ABU6YJA9_9FABA|nr:hypothetical protein [Stylosanthes scabra]
MRPSLNLIWLNKKLRIYEEHCGGPGEAIKKINTTSSGAGRRQTVLLTNCGATSGWRFPDGAAP